MSQRMALMQLQNALRGESDDSRQLWRKGVEKLGFENTLLEQNTGHRQDGPGASDESFLNALQDLSEPTPPSPGPAHKPVVDEVSPIEKLDLLIRLSKSNVILTDDQRLLVVAVAKTLLAPGARSDAQVTKLLNAIKAVEPGQQVIRVPDLEDVQRFARTTGPMVPRVATGKSDTVEKVLNVPRGLRLVKGLAKQSVVVVDTCVYKALVDGEAEYPVHLRTTISFEQGSPTVAKFKAVLEPENWPKFNPFWLDMSKILPKANGPDGVAGAHVAAAAETPEEGATKRAAPYIAQIKKIGWDSLGTYLEEVGFDAGPNGGGPVGAVAGHAGKVVALYPNTFLYFSRAKSTKERALMTYTLVHRQPPLLVDDGCIEIKKTDKGVDIVTTKSLYVKNVGSDTELAGILAYMAAYSGWGANTLMLVSNAAVN